jgi:hypothetical protein
MPLDRRHSSDSVVQEHTCDLIWRLTLPWELLHLAAGLLLKRKVEYANTITLSHALASAELRRGTNRPTHSARPSTDSSGRCLLLQTMICCMLVYCKLLAGAADAMAESALWCTTVTHPVPAERCCCMAPGAD